MSELLDRINHIRSTVRPGPRSRWSEAGASTS